MSITSRDVPNYEMLLEYVPRNRYEKNSITSARRTQYVSPLSNNIIGTTFPSTANAIYKIPASQSALLNLAECYFTISGQIQSNNTSQSSLFAASDQKSLPKFDKLWILRCLSTAQLKIGGQTVYNVVIPANLAKFKEMMYYDHDEIERGTEEINGLPSAYEDFQTVEGYLPTKNDPQATSDYTVKTNFATTPFSISQPNLFIKKPSKNSYYTVWWDTDNVIMLNFAVHLKLTDLFPIENLKPIYGQDVEIELNLDSAGYTGIKLTNTDHDSSTIPHDGICGTVNHFKQFRFCSITYPVNVNMISQLNKIYSKPIMEVIDDITYIHQSTHNTTENNTLNVKVPLSINFESDMIYIALPETTANNAREEATAIEDLENYTNHTPLDNRFMNISRVEVLCDSEIIYSHNYEDQKVDTKSASQVYKAIGLYDNNGEAKEYAKIGNYLPAYDLYKQCRAYCGASERGAMSFNEFLTSGFAICLPMSAFSRLTTGSLVELNITFGSGMKSVSLANTGKIGSLIQKHPGTAPGSTIELLNQLIIIQKSKKAIVFDGFNNCKIKQISQDFENDIDISESVGANTTKE